MKYHIKNKNSKKVLREERKKPIPLSLMQAKEYPCTECGIDSFIRYLKGWDGLVKESEELCTSCFKKRGGYNFFEAKGIKYIAPIINGED